MHTVDLANFNNTWYDRGASRWREMLWLLVSSLFFAHSLSVLSGVKVFWLRRFGAQVGRGVLIKPGARIKFPWRLTIGDHCWIGENVWIDNLAQVTIGSHVCISQGAMLLCGNHDYKKSTFDLIVQPIVLEDGVWIGAKSVVCPGVTCRTHAILTVGSVANKDLNAFGIYRGNPAEKVREREILE